jgi:hypothetical protein
MFTCISEEHATLTFMVTLKIGAACSSTTLENSTALHDVTSHLILPGESQISETFL